MRKYLIALAGLLIAAGAAAYLWWPRHVAPMSLRVSTGKLTDPPNRMTRFLVERAAKYKLHIELMDVAGSEHSLEMVDAGKIDVAFIRGGMSLGGRDNVRQVTCLDVEVFHLLVRGELLEAVEKDARVLQGKRISINKAATGTHYWSLDILDFLGLDPSTPAGKGNFTALTLDNPALLKACAALSKAAPEEQARLRADLPDAIVFGGPLPSAIPHRLVGAAGYRIVPMPFTHAYIQARRRDGFTEQALNPAAALEPATIPAFTYGVSPPVPAKDARVIGLRRVVIANKLAPAEAVTRLLRVIYLEQGEGALEPIELGKLRPEYEPHPAVATFKDEQEQVVQKTMMRVVEKTASVAGGVIGLIVAAWGYVRWRRLLRFEKFIHDVRQVDLLARGLRDDPAMPRERSERIHYLQGRLAEIRSAVISEFAGGHLQGETLILSILTLIGDTADAVPRLVRASPDRADEQPADQHGAIA
ncbi:MAG: hypothetical protein L0Y71_07075 [Gemmataceae bacterium]|nr:hypothetical protein [Gemmataceae bacterium]